MCIYVGYYFSVFYIHKLLFDSINLLFTHVFRISVSWDTLLCFLWHLFLLIFLLMPYLFVGNIYTTYFYSEKKVHYLISLCLPFVLRCCFPAFFFIILSYNYIRLQFVKFVLILLHHLFSNNLYHLLLILFFHLLVLSLHRFCVGSF